METIGPLMIVEGPNNSKVPHSRSLFINGSEKVLIDAGSDAQKLLHLNKEFGIDLIVNTHYHPDHTQFNYLFKQTEKWLNPIEFESIRTIDGAAKMNGVYEEWGEEGFKRWKQMIPKDFIESILSISGKYEYNKEYIFGDVKVIFLHTPGHTKGLACPYFPDLGVVYAGDYDMTSFGPWYNGTDGSIEDFIESGKMLLTLDADTYITAHHKGIFTKEEFKEEMEKYLAIIDKRDEKIAHYAQKSQTFEELANIGIFYHKKLLNEFMLRTWERVGIRKHLRRLGLSLPESKHKQAN